MVDRMPCDSVPRSATVEIIVCLVVMALTVVRGVGVSMYQLPASLTTPPPTHVGARRRTTSRTNGHKRVCCKRQNTSEQRSTERPNLSQHQTLGGGAIGDVFRATCGNRQVAIKQLKQQFRKDNKRVQNFVKEAKLMASMDQHPNIVQYIGIAGVNLSSMMVVFELLQGGDLRSWIIKFNQQKMARGFDRQRLQIAFDIAKGLTYLHSLKPKVLHRDLKSHNVLLNEKLEAKLTDFGISREESENMTVGMGTGRWMAPEVMNGSCYDEKADIFSFGVVLSELDTLDLPYASFRDEHGRQLNEAALMQQISSGAISVAFTETQLEEVVGLATQCVSFEAEARPSAAEVAFGLQQVLKVCNELSIWSVGTRGAIVNRTSCSANAVASSPLGRLPFTICWLSQ